MTFALNGHGKPKGLEGRTKGQGLCQEIMHLFGKTAVSDYH